MTRTIETDVKAEAGHQIPLRALPSYARRMASQAALGFNAGDTNLYRYVVNSPTNLTDPSGLQIRNVIEQAVARGQLRPASFHGKTLTVPGLIGGPNCTVDFKFTRALQGQIPQNFQGTLAQPGVHVLIDIKLNNCDCTCSQYKIVQLKNRKTAGGVWEIDSTTTSPYYISGLQLKDSPDALQDDRAEYRTYVLCTNPGKRDVVLAGVSWGFEASIDSNLANFTGSPNSLSKVPPLSASPPRVEPPVGFRRGMTTIRKPEPEFKSLEPLRRDMDLLLQAEFNRAVRKWNSGPGHQQFYVDYPLVPNP